MAGPHPQGGARPRCLIGASIRRGACGRRHPTAFAGPWQPTARRQEAARVAPSGSLQGWHWQHGARQGRTLKAPGRCARPVGSAAPQPGTRRVRAAGLYT